MAKRKERKRAKLRQSPEEMMRIMTAVAESHNAFWQTRPRSVLEHVTALRENVLKGCEAAGATVARTTREAAMLDGSVRFRGGCAIRWPTAATPSEEEARQHVRNALGSLGAVESYCEQDEEGVAALELQRAVESCERAKAALKRHGQDPRAKALPKREQNAKKYREKQRAALLAFAREAWAKRKEEHARDPRYWDVVEDVADRTKQKEHDWLDPIKHDRVESVLRKEFLRAHGLAFRPQ